MREEYARRVSAFEKPLAVKRDLRAKYDIKACETLNDILEGKGNAVNRLIAGKSAVYAALDAPVNYGDIENWMPTRTVEIEQLASEDFEIKPAIAKQPNKPDMSLMPALTEDVQRWLILPDMQIPYHDPKTLSAVLKYAKTIRWHGCIQLGDLMDWDWCSRWTVDNARTIEGSRFLSEYITANAVLDEIQEAVRYRNPSAQITILEGNHDWRVENVINKTPALEGLIEMEKNLRIKERGNMTYWRYWTHRQPYIIGKAWFIHGEYIGANHAKKTAESFGRNVFYGHTHDRSGHTKTTVSDDSVYCESLGTLSIRELEYMGRKPSNWMQCFAEFFIRPNGYFNHYVTNIVNNEFTAINGEFYAG